VNDQMGIKTSSFRSAGQAGVTSAPCEAAMREPGRQPDFRPGPTGQPAAPRQADRPDAQTQDVGITVPGRRIPEPGPSTPRG